MLNTSRQVGGSIGLAVLATLASARTRSLPGGLGSFGTHGNAYRTALAAGYDRAFTVGAGVAIAALLATFIIPARRSAAAPPQDVTTPVAEERPSTVSSEQLA